jgi:predicted CoA-binding protein
MESLVKNFLQQKSFAVVGSFRDETKFAYKIFRDLIGKGYEVFPVNPQVSEVDGRICYKSISAIPCHIDVANIVTPPVVTESILKECLQKGIRKVWLQPGAESQAAINFCKDNNIDIIHRVCVMMEGAKGEESQ